MKTMRRFVVMLAVLAPGTLCHLSAQETAGARLAEFPELKLPTDRKHLVTSYAVVPVLEVCGAGRQQGAQCERHRKQ